MKNILIITYWSYKDALIQTYTLPYVKVIRENLSDDQKIYLVTLEQDSLRMNNNDSIMICGESVNHCTLRLISVKIVMDKIK